MKKVIVFTCGCYDLFHIGHLETLKEARKFGDYIIVGISSDEVIKKAKGEGRPIMGQEERAKIIAEITGVDEVIVGKNKDFVDFILNKKPDVYLKGGDYNINTINQDERKAVESYGGKIMFSKFIKRRSTTKIIDEIKYKDYCKKNKVVMDESGEMYEICNDRK